MRGCYSLSVAELALGHILNVYRNISGYVNDMRNGTESWVIKAPIEFPDRDRELSGQKVGIIGFGGVGQHLSRFLKPFTDDIVVSDPYIPQEVLDQYGVKKGDIKDIFSECDVIVSCAANNTATEKLINKELIDSIKPGALFMNMGRAILVDNEALLERIRKHDIYVVMDVFEVEPLPKDHEFRKHENVYMTTHRGGTLYSFYQIFDNFVEDLEGVMERGEEAKWPVRTSQLHALRDYK